MQTLHVAKCLVSKTWERSAIVAKAEFVALVIFLSDGVFEMEGEHGEDVEFADSLGADYAQLQSRFWHTRNTNDLCGLLRLFMQLDGTRVAASYTHVAECLPQNTQKVQVGHVLSRLFNCIQVH